MSNKPKEHGMVTPSELKPHKPPRKGEEKRSPKYSSVGGVEGARKAETLNTGPHYQTKPRKRPPTARRPPRATKHEIFNVNLNPMVANAVRDLAFESGINLSETMRMLLNPLIGNIRATLRTRKPMRYPKDAEVSFFEDAGEECAPGSTETDNPDNLDPGEVQDVPT